MTKNQAYQESYVLFERALQILEVSDISHDYLESVDNVFSTTNKYQREREKLVREARKIRKALRGKKVKPVNGVCCSCGYKGKKETPCKVREDDTHCEHWWDGPDMEKAP
ncbi:Uncharacterised protein [uncultured archaeon]|nr:Uncharacterised protein [uncultured archaeon]